MIAASARRRVAFDLGRGRFVERTPPLVGVAPPGREIALEEVHALQIIVTRDDKATLELNLVLRDASRVNLMRHADRMSLREDAQSIARRLGRPLWSYD